MLVTKTDIPGVLLIEPKVFGDERGFFLETFSVSRYAEAGIPGPFVQDNLARSARGVLRGLHLQNPHSQGKLVSVLEGEVLDVAVDVRVGSPAFGKSVAYVLSGQNKRQLWIPPGLAHGYAVISESALFFYKCTDLYHPEHELGVRWDDPALGIDWPLKSPTLSGKDKAYPVLAEIDRAKLPIWSEK